MRADLAAVLASHSLVRGFDAKGTSMASYRSRASWRMVYELVFPEASFAFLGRLTASLLKVRKAERQGSLDACLVRWTCLRRLGCRWHVDPRKPTSAVPVVVASRPSSWHTARLPTRRCSCTRSRDVTRSGDGAWRVTAVEAGWGLATIWGGLDGVGVTLRRSSRVIQRGYQRGARLGRTDAETSEGRAGDVYDVSATSHEWRWRCVIPGHRRHLCQDIGDTRTGRAPVDMAGYLVEAHLREGRSVAELAAAHGVHRSWIYKLLARYRAEGDAGLAPRSRRPRSSPTATPPRWRRRSSAAQAAQRGRPRRRGGDHPLAPGP